MGYLDSSGLVHFWEKVNEKISEAVANIPSSGSGVPIGSVVMWIDPDNIPAGWHICDGTDGTPDLRGRFVLGNSDSHEVGETGGNEEVTLTVEQIPNHAHTLKTVAASGSVTGGVLDAAFTTSKYSRNDKAVGNGQYDGLNGQPHPNMPPYYVMVYIMKMS